MKWLPVARKDGKPDPYAYGLCTHTVATVYVGGKPTYEAFRFKNPAERIGSFSSPEAAQLACEQDARGERGEAA